MRRDDYDPEHVEEATQAFLLERIKRFYVGSWEIAGASYPVSRDIENIHGSLALALQGINVRRRTPKDQRTFRNRTPR